MRNFIITIDGKQYQVGVEEVGATPSQVTPVVTEVKPVQAARELMPNARLEKPYDGAKDMLLADELEDREFLKKLFEAMYEELPAPKKKK